jgi:hypothetical protein
MKFEFTVDLEFEGPDMGWAVSVSDAEFLLFGRSGLSTKADVLDYVQLCLSALLAEQ